MKSKGKAIIKKLEDSKGSVTLFVMVSVVFFLMILMVVNESMNNKFAVQNTELAQIQGQYEKGDMEEEYQEIIQKLDMKIYIVLYKQDGTIYDGNEWINESLKLKIYYPDTVKEEDRYYYVDGVKTKYTENEVISGNCTIIAEYNNTRKTIVVDKIDKKLPTASIEKNGGTYIIEPGKTTSKVTTKIIVKDEGGSGLVENLYYQITTSPNIPAAEDANWKKFTNGEEIAEEVESGTWYIYTKVMDKAGNMATDIQKSNAYYVKYKIQYNTNGANEQIEYQTKAKGASITLSTTIPTKTGNTFTGWSSSPTGEVEYLPGDLYTKNESIVLYAQWEMETYTITYNLNGGTVEGNPATYTVETSDITLKNPTKTGYTFSGWTGSNGETAQTTVIIAKGSTGNKTYTANWTIDTYKITYNLNGGTVEGNPATYTVETSDITLKNPTKTG